jgi:hypothetical protein
MLANEAVVPWTGRTVSRAGYSSVMLSIVVLAGRATRVPHWTDNLGIERIPTVNIVRPLSWLPIALVVRC